MSDVEELNEQLMADLRSVSVATLTTVLYRRGFRNQFLQAIGPLDPGGRRMAGPAFTMRTIPAREDKAVPAVLSDRKYPGRAAIEALDTSAARAQQSAELSGPTADLQHACPGRDLGSNGLLHRTHASPADGIHPPQRQWRSRRYQSILTSIGGKFN